MKHYTVFLTQLICLGLVLQYGTLAKADVHVESYRAATKTLVTPQLSSQDDVVYRRQFSQAIYGTWELFSATQPEVYGDIVFDISVSACILHVNMTETEPCTVRSTRTQDFMSVLHDNAAIGQLIPCLHTRDRLTIYYKNADLRLQFVRRHSKLAQALQQLNMGIMMSRSTGEMPKDQLRLLQRAADFGSWSSATQLAAYYLSPEHQDARLALYYALKIPLLYGDQSTFYLIRNHHRAQLRASAFYLTSKHTQAQKATLQATELAAQLKLLGSVPPYFATQ